MLSEVRVRSLILEHEPRCYFPSLDHLVYALLRVKLPFYYPSCCVQLSLTSVQHFCAGTNISFHTLQTSPTTGTLFRTVMSEQDWESVGDDSDIDKLREHVDEWSAKSNEALHLELHDGQGEVLQTFNPEFTYSIFGDEEAIFGYQDLDIQLSFASHNLEPRLRVNYGKKFEQLGDVAATDIEELMRDFLPPVAFEKTPRSSEEAYKWKPPGKQVHSYTNDKVNYEIWCADLSNKEARKILENVQVLVPLFIEGGSALELDHEGTAKRWKLWLLYANYNNAIPSNPTISQYELAGYATSYRVFTFPSREIPSKADLELFLPTYQGIDEFLPPPSLNIPNETMPTINPGGLQTPLDFPSRERLSQFLILPPHHRRGHGVQLYKTMLHNLTSRPNVREMTVEDPNEAFDDLRDLCDLHTLRANPTFSSLALNTTTIPAEKLKRDAPIPVETIVPLPQRQTVLAEAKIDQRQFDRMVEAHLLSTIPAQHRSRSRITRKEKSSNDLDRAYYFWRLYVKHRLYVFNRDQLKQAEAEERVEKLEAAADSVEEGYVKLLERVEGLRDREGDAIGGAEGGVRSVRGKRKRAVALEDDAEDEEGGEGEGVSGGGSGNGKKARN